MISNNSILYTIKILLEIARDFIFFPVWWYSVGLYRFLTALFNFLKGVEKSLALSVWIKNIFKPMFGQSDWQGRLISIFIRIVQIIARSIVMFIVLIFVACLFALWIIFPLLVIYEIIFQFL